MYSLLDPKVCGYYRGAVYLMSTSQGLIPKSADIHIINNNNSPTPPINLLNPTDGNGEMSAITDREQENSDLHLERNMHIDEDDILEITFETDFQVSHSEGGVDVESRRTSTPLKKSTARRAPVVSLEERFNQLQCLFGNYYECDELDYKAFIKNLNRFKAANKNWSKVNSVGKAEYYNFFSPINWQKLSDTEKLKHTRFCNECTITNAYYQALFPSTSKRYMKERKENVVRVINKVKRPSKKSKLKDITRNIYNTINTEFESKFGVPFSEGLVEMPELKLQTKPSAYEKKKEKRALTRTVKNKLQKDMNETAVDRLFGTRLSLTKWDTLRGMQSFETVTDAIKSYKRNRNKSIIW